MLVAKSRNLGTQGGGDFINDNNDDIVFSKFFQFGTFLDREVKKHINQFCMSGSRLLSFSEGGGGDFKMPIVFYKNLRSLRSRQILILKNPNFCEDNILVHFTTLYINLIHVSFNFPKKGTPLYCA